MRTGITTPVIGLPRGVLSSGLRYRYRMFRVRNQCMRPRSPDLSTATINEWELVGVRTRFVGERCHECGSRPEQVLKCWRRLPTRRELRVLCHDCATRIGLVW